MGLQKQLGTTFVHVTHDQDEAMSIADKIVVLNEGRVEQIGPHDALIAADGLYRELYDPDWAKQRDELRAERIRRLAEVA